MLFDGVDDDGAGRRPDPWQHRETTVEYLGAKRDWPWPIALFTWCFSQIYSREHPFDEIITPIAMLQVMATYLAGLGAIAGLWREALVVQAIGMTPILAFCAIAGLTEILVRFDGDYYED